jgi:SAM-dependent methyltransferase
VLEGLRGRVLEVGAGDGRSFEHYPAEVESVLAVEPDPHARAAAAERAAEARVPIEVVEGLADALPAEGASFDAAVSMGLLCSVPDPAAALAELRRVLVPGGELRFWEHVRARGAAFRGLQHACDRLFWTEALGGCRTTRDTLAAIVRAGFEPERVERGFHSSSLLTITSAPYVLGVAARTRELTWGRSVRAPPRRDRAATGRPRGWPTPAPATRAPGRPGRAG